MMNTEIHDLGYTRYTGPRRPPAQRFRVIARNVFAIGWRSRWGVKLPLVLAVGTTVAASVAMYFLRSELADVVRMRGAPLPRAEQIIFIASMFFEVSAFIIALAVGCRVVADDLRLGAFQFYFARALRPRDYVVGKLGGLALLIGIPMLGGPTLPAPICLVNRAFTVWRVLRPNSGTSFCTSGPKVRARGSPCRAVCSYSTNSPTSAQYLP